MLRLRPGYANLRQRQRQFNSQLSEQNYIVEKIAKTRKEKNI